jgi:hypothetical protein
MSLCDIDMEIVAVHDKVLSWHSTEIMIPKFVFKMLGHIFFRTHSTETKCLIRLTDCIITLNVKNDPIAEVR